MENSKKQKWIRHFKVPTSVKKDRIAKFMAKLKQTIKKWEIVWETLKSYSNS